MRNQLTRALITFFLFYSIIFYSGCSEFPTIHLTSELQKKLKHEEFELIYNESSSDLRRSIDKQEFIDKLKAFVVVMRKADPELNWQIGPANGDSYGRAEGNLKFYNAERVLGGKNEDVFVHMTFVEETRGVAKLDFLRVIDCTVEPYTTVSMP